MRDHPRAARRKVYKPFPDAIAPGFAVVPGQGAVDLVGKVMAVPLGNSDLDRFTKLHEMIHLTITPAGNPAEVARENGITIDALQVCEDARVNTTGEDAFDLPMSRLGKTEPLDQWRAEMERLKTKNRTAAVKFAAETLVAFQGRNARGMERIIRNAGLREALDLAGCALGELQPDDNGKIPFSATIRAAKILSNGASALGELDGSPADVPADAIRAALNNPNTFVPWGTMEIEQPSRHARFGAKVSPRQRATDSGVRLRNVSRVLTDGRVFTTRVKQNGGALLLDGSGSMDMQPEQVREILSISPLAWVGIYGANSRAGTLKILAKDGKAVAPEEMRSPGGCNVIDGPALEVLAKQSAPRIWICDGHVTGVGDMGGIGNVAACAKICTAANIRRIDTVADAITYLRSLTKVR